MTRDAMGEPFRLGVVGAGKISRILLPMLAARGIAVRAIFDVNGEAARAMAAQLEGAEAAGSMSALLEDPALDGIYLASPPAAHREQVLQAARAGKPVIGEKPWVLGADEARLLAEELEGCPPVPVASCASRFRFTPATAAAAACLREGALDRVRLVRVSAVTPPPAPLAELPPWKRSAAAAGGGLAADWCVYEIDWLAAVFGAAFDPVEVTATLDDWRREGTGLDSGYTAHLRCASGLDVRLDRRAEIAPRQHRVEIRCEHGGIDLPFAPDTSDRIARLHRPAEDGKGIVSKEIAPALDDWSDILCGPLVNLADAVRGTAPVAATPASQILVHTLLDAIYRSGREGKSVLLEKP